MERNGEKNFRTVNGLPKQSRKPMTPEALKNLSTQLDNFAELGQAEMRRDSGITLPSRLRSTRHLRRNNNPR